MPAGLYNFTIEQGATFSKTFTYKDAAGVPVNITGFSVRMMARREYGDATPLISLSTTLGGITITEGAAGQFRLDISATGTAALDFTQARYDLEIVDLAGRVIRLLQGTITLSKENTK